MTVLSPVIWSEGMHLAQHHFQAQGRYFEERTSFAFSALYFCPWGVAACEFDDEALANGIVTIRHSRGVMPDGLPFAFPEEEPPEPLAISELFTPTSTSARVLLAIPAYHPDRANLGGQGDGADRRFVVAATEIADEATGADTRPVELAGKNFRLLLDSTEIPEDLVTLPIARVERDGSGRFVYARDFIPPAVRVGASPRLVALMSGLSETLEQKTDGLREKRREGGGSEVVEFWLAHAINSGLAPLRHHLRTGSAHPEALYRDLSRMAGALCTFAMDAHPRDLPDYDHTDLEMTFTALERHIRRNLDVVLPEQAIRIPLQADQRFFHRGRLGDARVLGRSARWFLGIRSSLARSEVLREVPRLVKVCSDDGIEKLVQRAYDGLPTEHALSPPPALSPKIGTEYFHLGASGPCWKAITMSEGVGVYVPGVLAEGEVELLVILEE